MNNESPYKSVKSALLYGLLLAIVFYLITLNFKANPIYFRWGFIFLTLYILVNYFYCFYQDIEINHKMKLSVFIRGIILIIWGTILWFATIYITNSEFGIGIINYNGLEYVINFFEAIYYSSVTFFSLGYGDFAPTGLSRFFSILEVFIGQILIITFIGSAIGNKEILFKEKKRRNKNE